jgi:L-ascorbate metabolism protein UlaG (beta-lactamase superfamily)
MYIFLIFVIVIVLLVVSILNLPVFGKKPAGQRLARIKRLPLYHDGAIQNQSPTPTLPPDVSFWKMFWTVIKGNPNGSPKLDLPHHKPDFNFSDTFKLTWFGHSSYLIQVDGKNILVDPVFSERPSPFQFIGTKRFGGTNFVSPSDFPMLDVILITHDHYDHLDYAAILELKDKTKCFVTSLGVGAHLEHWGVEADKIVELVWDEQISVCPELSFTALPARHFSGREFKRNQTLWSSFVLRTLKYNLYLGGDSGYDEHFTTIGEQYGPFDLAILECGQYNEMWPLIHLFPEQTVDAAINLNAKRLLPVHWGKYKLALHHWDDSIKRVSIAATAKKMELATPMLGEAYTFENPSQSNWWLNL